MRVFISWSGERSKSVATILRDWLPSVIQAVNPWMSAEDIGKGARWSKEVASNLDEIKFGIICLTPENLAAPWLLFEAGALSKTLETARVSPVLFDLNQANVKDPLAQFQMTEFKKDDVLKLMKDINAVLSAPLSSENLTRAFDMWWPRLQEQLEKVSLLPPEKPQTRSTDEKVDEILERVRQLNRQRSLSEIQQLLNAQVHGSEESREPGIRMLWEAIAARRAQIEKISKALGQEAEDS